MGRLQHQIRFLMGYILILYVEYNTKYIELTQRHTNISYGVLTLSLFQLYVQPVCLVTFIFNKTMK